MRASVICLALAVVASANLFADPISGTFYSTSCSADGSSMTVGTQSCSAGIPMQGALFAAADANVVATVAVNAAQYSDLHARQDIRLNTGQGSTLTAGATSNVSYSENFTTAGPLRSGFMLVQLVNRNLTAGDNSIGRGNFSMSLIPTKLCSTRREHRLRNGCGSDGVLFQQRLSSALQQFGRLFSGAWASVHTWIRRKLVGDGESAYG